MERLISEESNRHMKNRQASHLPKKNWGSNEVFFGTYIILGPTTIVQDCWSLHTEEDAKPQKSW